MERGNVRGGEKWKRGQWIYGVRGWKGKGRRNKRRLDYPTTKLQCESKKGCHPIHGYNFVNS